MWPAIPAICWAERPAKPAVDCTSQPRRPELSSFTFHSTTLSPDGTLRSLTSQFTAADGRTGGAAVSMVTKSGTNELIGSAYYYQGNDGLLGDQTRDTEVNLVFDEEAGRVDPISCLDALLFARQAARVSQLEQPTEFIASVLRRDTPEGTRVLVVFGAGSEMFVPRGWYGFDLVGDYLADGWKFWYTIHNHTTQKNGSRLALGVPVPSTSDVKLLRSLAAELGLDSVRVTNGFYTFRAAVEELSQFRAR